MSISAEDWITRFATLVGLAPLSSDEFELVLKLAAESAHCSERKAAPVTTWLAGRAGLEPADALALAERVSRELEAQS
jgi:hypothetical protein